MSNTPHDLTLATAMAADPITADAAGPEPADAVAPADDNGDAASELAVADFFDGVIPDAADVGADGVAAAPAHGHQGWRGLRRFDGLGAPVDLLVEIALDACLPRAAVRALHQVQLTVIVITVPSPAWVKPVAAVIRRISRGEAQCVVLSAAPRPSNVSAVPDLDAADLVAAGRPVVAITPDRDWIAPLFPAAADHSIVVPPFDVDRVGLAVNVWCGRRARRALAPGDLSGLDLPDLAAALRPGSTPKACVARIRRASRARVGPAGAETVVPLDQLTGYGEAQSWAIRTVADIARVRRGELSASVLEGAVLHGPPGTGKTTLARSLARAAGIVCVETSVGQWFASSPGFLDSIVKQIAMFSDRLALAARQDGCAIGFCDELDAMPNRARLNDRGASWWLPAITYWLIRVEALRRAGVILLGATNDLSRIDAALLRPGRFDRQFWIGPPDEAGRLGILRAHLGDDLAGEDLSMTA